MLKLDWTQGDTTGQVEVPSTTKASELQSYLAAESCEANMSDASIKVRVSTGTSAWSMKKDLAVLISKGDPEVEPAWKIFISEPPPVQELHQNAS